jgi:hypothetical protein
MKINWGGKLLIIALMFMLFVVSMVVVISKQDMPLVEQDYYERSLNYQKEIDNHANIDTSVQVNLVSTNLEVSSSTNLSGVKVKFYRPSNPELDKDFVIDILAGKKEVYDLSHLHSGKWVLSVVWMKADKEFKISKNFER